MEFFTSAAFATARARSLPVFLYWNIAWCPPCNRINGTLLADPAFAHLAERCIMLQVDGDSPGAQELAARLRLRSYPTLVLYRPDASEITRLPCELAVPELLMLFNAALGGGRASLAPQTSADWLLTAHYAWDTDEDALLGGRDLAATLAALHASCPVPALAVRFDWLRHDARAVAAPLHADLVIEHGPALALAYPGTASAIGAALDALANSPAQPVIDQLAALRSRVRVGPFDADLARAQIARSLAATTSPPLRHYVANAAAAVLSTLGLLDEAQQLLLDATAESHAPYYFMQSLASLARQRGDTGAALAWHQRAWEQAHGASTRVQWGVTYLLALRELAPHDTARSAAICAALRQLAQGPLYQRDLSQIGKVRDIL